MNVLYLNGMSARGGASRSFVEMVSQMRGLGVNTYVLTSKDNEVNQKFTDLGIRNAPIGYREVLQSNAHAWYINASILSIRGILYYSLYWPTTLRILATMRNENISIIHSNSTHIDVGCEIARRINAVNIMHLREFSFDDYNCVSYRINLEKYYNRHVTRYISISKAVKSAWSKRGLDESKISVVYNGVDSQLIKPAEKWKGLPDKLKLCIIGGVFETKGQHQVVEALAKLPTNVKPNITLDIIGQPHADYLRRLKRIAKDGGIEAQVSFLGERKDVYDRLQDYHIGFMCSRAEAFGRVTVEYMHAGLGVIASNTGANPEIISDGVNGLLFPYGDADALAQRITGLYTHPERLAAMADAGRQSAKERFTMERNAKGVFDVYNEIINIMPPPASQS
jgi:glycosyltransferase involved in cell wall biosynthesis